MFYEKKAKLMERAINHLNEAWDVIYECQEIEMKQGDPEYAVEFQEMMAAVSATTDEFAELAFPSFQGGIDFVPRNMPAFLHEGERVTPANQNIGITNNFASANVNGDAIGKGILRAMERGHF